MNEICKLVKLPTTGFSASYHAFARRTRTARESKRDVQFDFSWTLKTVNKKNFFFNVYIDIVQKLIPTPVLSYICASFTLISVGFQEKCIAGGGGGG